jgi:hypothetical protein
LKNALENRPGRSNSAEAGILEYGWFCMIRHFIEQLRSWT